MDIHIHMVSVSKNVRARCGGTMKKPKVTWVLWVKRRCMRGRKRLPDVWVKTAEATAFDNWASGKEILQQAARCFVPAWCVLPAGKKPSP